jgi:hypothetical protein
VKPREANLKRVYKTLLHLYPYDFRAWFAGEMLSAFEKSAEEFRARTWAPYIHFALAELAGVATGALGEWVAKWTGDPLIRARCLPDWRMMRPVGIPREVFFAGAGAARERWRNRCSSDT